MTATVATCVPWEWLQTRRPCKPLAMVPDTPPQVDVDGVDRLAAAADSTLEAARCQARGRCRKHADAPNVSRRMQDCLQAVLNQLEMSGARASVLKRLLSRDVPAKLVTCLSSLDFEAQKDASRLFGTALRLGMPLGLGSEVAEYMRSRPHIPKLLLDGCGVLEVVSQCADMLRSCTRCPQLVDVLHDEDAAIQLVKLAQHPTFEISSEAFSLLQALLLDQKEASAAYLVAHFEEFFGLYNKLLQVEDYVTQRQAERLLSDILLDQSFMDVMLAYVDSEKYLQIHMNLLRDDSKAIQLDAFHVFKIFVVNPHKPRKVQQILFQNREKLARLLESILDSRTTSDKALIDDMYTVLNTLSALEAPPSRKNSPATSFTAAPAGFVTPIAAM